MDLKWAILVLLEFVLLTVLSLASVLILAWALFFLRKLQAKNAFLPAPSLRVYLWSLMICSLAVSFNGIIMSAMWRTTGYYQETAMFWTGVWDGSLITAVPAAVFFVSADRLLIICMPMRYSDRMRNAIAWLSIGTIVSMTALNFGVNVVTYDLKKVDGCWSFACLTSDQSMAVYAATRFIVALPNFAISVAFLIALYRLNRKNDKSALFQKRKTSDQLALLVVVFELIFDLLPSFINLILTYEYDINISTRIGPYRQLLNAANALCCAVAHVKVLRRIANDLQSKRLTSYHFKNKKIIG